MGHNSRQGPGPCPMCGGKTKKQSEGGTWYWVCLKYPDDCQGFRRWNNKNVITMAQEPGAADKRVDESW